MQEFGQYMSFKNGTPATSLASTLQDIFKNQLIIRKYY